MGYIYQIRNKTNGKLYIGQTDNVEERWKGHRKASSNCRYLKHAFNKYGFENFEFKVLVICFDDDMNTYEVEYMHKYNTLVPNGYNLREGGNSGKHHEERKFPLLSSQFRETL
jgi:group I intron endonuclease